MIRSIVQRYTYREQAHIWARAVLTEPAEIKIVNLKGWKYFALGIFLGRRLYTYMAEGFSPGLHAWYGG